LSYDDAPTLRPQLRELVLDGLRESTGDQAAEPDGPVVLGDAATARRLAALGGLTFVGRRVLELGAGIGDLSRHARRSGAELVDAVDRDPERVELGRLLTVLQGIDRISWFEGDAGLASTYADEYDFILAFGPALEAMRPILPRVVQNLRGVLVCELRVDRDEAIEQALTGLLPAHRALVEEDGVAVGAWAAEHSVLLQHLAGDGAGQQAEVPR
jgi:SAM-dependent methyltransferase